MLSKNYQKKIQKNRDVSSEKDITCTQQTEKYKYGVSNNQWMNRNNIVDEYPYDSISVLNHIPATAQTVLLKIFARKNLGSKYQKTISIVPIPLETERTMWASKIGRQRTQYTKQRGTKKF